MMTSSPAEMRGSRAEGGDQREGAGKGGGPLAGLRRFNASMIASHGWYALLAEFVRQFQKQQPSMLAKQTAYSLLYAIPSILIVLISLAAIVDKNTGFGISDALQGFIAEQAPANLQPLLASLVHYALVETSENTAIVAALVSLAIAIWSAAGGVGALIYAVNDVYDIHDRRSFIKSAVTRVGLMVLGGIMVVAAFLLLAFSRLLLDHLPLIAAAGGPLEGILSSGPFIALVLIFGSLLLLYWFALDTPKSFRWLLPGAALATAAIVVLVTLLDLILTYSNPGAAYGAVGSVLILLWTLFMLSQIVVVGAIVNAVLGRHFDQTLIAGLQARPAELPDDKRVAMSVYR